MKQETKDTENLRHKQHMAKRVRTLVAELAAANEHIDALRGACVGHSETAQRVAGERDAMIQRIDEERAVCHARIEALHADLRVRTEERDVALRDARKYAETRQLADDLQAELAAVKVALAESESVVKDWEFSSIQQASEIGKMLGHMRMLATMVKRGLPAAEGVADYILSLELKPCAT